MVSIPNPKIISTAWTDVLSEFVQKTHSELLVMSPWITIPVARLISHSLANSGPIKLQILARFDETDFLGGLSHVEAFKQETYPPNARPDLRALPLLHGKMLLADRERVIIGSANMTDGGLYRNHEMCLLLESSLIGQKCAEAFFDFWQIGSPVPDDYLSTVEALVEERLPKTDEEDNHAGNASAPLVSRKTRRSSEFKYVRPSHSGIAQRHLSSIHQIGPPPEEPPEEYECAMSWLTRTLKFLPRQEKSTEGVLKRLERLMYHPNLSVRATAIDRVGRNGFKSLVPRLQVIATNKTESEKVRSAATFSLGILGSNEALPALASLCSEQGDVGRWARRGCFLLLAVINEEDQAWLLRELQVHDPPFVIDLAERCLMSSGALSERLTKALLLEKYATGAWTELDVEILTCIMVLLAQILKTSTKHFSLSTVYQSVAKEFGIAPGDLRHGPLSPSLLKSLVSSGFSDHGLSLLLAPAWARFSAGGTLVKDTLATNPRFRQLLEIIETYEPVK